MENKWQTLQAIVDMLKTEPKPLLCALRPMEIIARLRFPWDEIMQHVSDLHSDGFIILQQQQATVIHITEEGLHYFSEKAAS